MGYQLWTSSLSGYRRRGTRLADLRDLFDTGITAQAIFEPLKSCPMDAPAFEMAETLRLLDFDVAGAQENEAAAPCAYVSREALLAGIVRDHAQPFRAEDLVSDSTGMADLLKLLARQPHAFVLVGAGVRGIITRADLNKPPVRVCLFGLVSLFEMHMNYWIAEVFPNGSWRQRLTEVRIKTAEKFRKERQRRGQDLGLLACLQFCDKRDLILCDRATWAKFGIEDETAARDLLRKAGDVRDRLAHSNEDISEGFGWTELARVIGNLEGWLFRSDQAVEERAQVAAACYVDPLIPAGGRARGRPGV